MIWTAVAGVRYSIEQIRRRRTSALLIQVWKWFAIIVKSSALLSIWVRMILVADHVMSRPFHYARVLHLLFGDQSLFLVSDICHPSANWASF